MPSTDPNNATPWWKPTIVGPVVAGLVLLTVAGFLGGVFDRNDEHATTPSAATPPPTPPSSALTVGEFAQRANEICVDSGARAGEFDKFSDLVSRAIDGDRSAERALGPLLERFKNVLRDRRQRLKALGAPQGEAQATAEEFVSADSSIQYRAIAFLSDIQDALRTGDQAELVDLVSRWKQDAVASSRESARREALAEELGAGKCG
jgi:hypothetical protein